MRKWLWFGLGLALVLVAAAVALLTWPRGESPVNAESAARVRPGMTLGEVESVFGGPPGDYRVRSRSRFFAIGLAPLPGNAMKEWRGDDGLAMIQLGPDGRVAVAQFFTYPRVDESLLEQVLNMLGL